MNVRLRQTLLLVLTVFSSYSQESIGPVSSYYFSGNANDSIGDNDGKVSGASLSADRFGNQNAAYYFDGVDDYITLGTNSSLKQITMSISLWVKINSYTANFHNYPNQPFICTKARNSEEFYEAYFVGMYKTNQKFDAAVTSSLHEQIPSIASIPAMINAWYHVVYMFDADTTYLYVNSSLQQKNYKGFLSVYLKSDSVVLGYTGNYTGDKYSWLNGCLDDIKIFNRILTPAEISTLYNEPNPLFGIKIEYYKHNTDLESLFLRFWFIPLAFILSILATIFLVKQRIKYIRKRDKEKTDLQQQFIQMEMQALRSQMNPHFIFNAINSIQYFVLSNEKELANKYLIMFSNLMRNVLELSKLELINLKDELETVAMYVQIEALRFEKDFNLALIFPETIHLENITIPPLLIQPFVENAIWHGLLLKEGKKELTISAYKKESLVVIEIDDNGIGRAAASRFPQKEKKRKSLGMEITKDRLTLLEKAYGISISVEIVDKLNDSGLPTGTKALITIKSKT